MKKMILTGLALFSLASYAQSPERLVVKLKSGMELPKLSSIIRAQHFFGSTYVLYTQNAEALKQQFQDMSNTVYIEDEVHAGKRKLPEVEKLETPDFEKGNASPFNDPKVSKIWSFDDRSDNGISINKTYAENATAPVEQIIVAVVDTGVDYNHEDLKDVMWTNPGEIAGNGIDDDNNGYIDDVHGINTLKRDSQGNATADMMDTHSHGTHVSGTIGAKQNNGIGIAGITSNVRIMGIRTIPNNDDETDIDVAESFLYAAKMGAKIINCSFGKSKNEGGNLVKDTIDHIGQQYGVLVIAAAGNDSTDIDRRQTWPASYESDNLMVVASTSSSGGLSGFSNYGSKSVDIAAPGSSIYSSTPGNRYGSMSGTSMACPTTVGVAAEVLANNPALTPVELKKLLMDTVTPIGRFSGRLASAGRVDLLRALTGK